jgi:hypothetical protein
MTPLEQQYRQAHAETRTAAEQTYKTILNRRHAPHPDDAQNLAAVAAVLGKSMSDIEADLSAPRKLKAAFVAVDHGLGPEHTARHVLSARALIENREACGDLSRYAVTPFPGQSPTEFKELCEICGLNGAAPAGNRIDAREAIPLLVKLGFPRQDEKEATAGGMPAVGTADRFAMSASPARVRWAALRVDARLAGRKLDADARRAAIANHL